MPNTKSAKKRLRQNEARRARNRAVKSAIRTQIRKVREAVVAGDLTRAASEFRRACQRLDRAGTRGIIHPNRAARLKSRLNARLKAAAQAAAG